MNQYFPGPCERSDGAVIDLSNYLRKVDLKGATGIDTSTVS